MSERILEFTEGLIAKEAAQAEAAARKAATMRQCDLPAFEGWDGKTCFDCEDPLPAPRVAAGRVRCVACQSKIERAEVRARQIAEFGRN
jgi:RNA polymerase-binding transcription factor DksA